MSGKLGPDAFRYYVSLGPVRSYAAVAQHFGTSKRAVTKCAAREGWQKRLDAIEKQAREREDEELVDIVNEMRDRHLKTAKAIQGRALVALRQYPLNSGMEAVRAAELSIKLERLIVGEPSERSQISVEEVTRREMREWLTVVEEDDDDGEEG